MTKKFKVHLLYRGSVNIDVVAADEKAAEQEAIKLGDDIIGANLHVHDVIIEEAE